MGGNKDGRLGSLGCDDVPQVPDMCAQLPASPSPPLLRGRASFLHPTGFLTWISESSAPSPLPHLPPASVGSEPQCQSRL